MKSFQEFEITEVATKDENALFTQLNKAKEAVAVLQENIQQLTLDLQFFSTNKEDIIEDVDWIIRKVPNLNGEMMKLKKLVKRTKE